MTSEASFGYLKNEGERLVLESLDELEVALLSSKQKTDCNHIFLNFAPTVVYDPHEIAQDVESNIIMRYAGRFMKLKVSPPLFLPTLKLSFNNLITIEKLNKFDLISSIWKTKYSFVIQR